MVWTIHSMIISTCSPSLRSLAHPKAQWHFQEHERLPVEMHRVHTAATVYKQLQLHRQTRQQLALCVHALCRHILKTWLRVTSLEDHPYPEKILSDPQQQNITILPRPLRSTAEKMSIKNDSVLARSQESKQTSQHISHLATPRSD